MEESHVNKIYILSLSISVLTISVFYVCVWQKTTALKKAYAEIILNTAKESAARVMLSDRKSARFHHDLSQTKEEALRLLVRLKHMIDAKVIFCSLSKKETIFNIVGISV